MTRADLEAAAEEKYPDASDREFVGDGSRARERAAYIQGRLDQAEADARIAEEFHEVEAEPGVWMHPDAECHRFGCAEQRSVRLRLAVCDGAGCDWG